MSITEEWNELVKNLSADDLKDGRRCFYCGALMMIVESIEGRLTPEAMIAFKDEIETALTREQSSQGD